MPNVSQIALIFMQYFMNNIQIVTYNSTCDTWHETMRAGTPGQYQVPGTVVSTDQVPCHSDLDTGSGLLFFANCF